MVINRRAEDTRVRAAEAVLPPNTKPSLPSWSINRPPIRASPHPSSGQTWYQSFTAEHSSKLQKFAFVTNGAFTASATVKIREGEGVTGTVLHIGTWTGIGSNTNNYNEYVIGNGVVLTQGQKYTIQLENQTAGGFIGSNANQYAGGKFHYSGYGGEYGDLKMKIWVCGKLKAVVINRRAEDTRQAVASTLMLSIRRQWIPISSCKSSDNGYQTPGQGYQSPEGQGYQSPGQGYQSPGQGYQSRRAWIPISGTRLWTRLSIARLSMDTNLRDMAIKRRDMATNLRDTAINRRGMDTNLRDTVIKRRDTATNRRGMDTNLRDTVIKRQPMRTTYWILPTKSLKFGRWGIKSFRTIFF